MRAEQTKKKPAWFAPCGLFDVQCNASRHVSSTRIRLLCALPARSAKLAETETAIERPSQIQNFPIIIQ